MKLTLDPVPNVVSSAPAPKPKLESQPSASTPRLLVDTTTKQAPVPAAPSHPTVTFRKDSNGKIYYIVTDSESGKEIRQIPADAVRKAAQGIDEFLKQQETKSSHVEVKA